MKKIKNASHLHDIFISQIALTTVTLTINMVIKFILLFLETMIYDASILSIASIGLSIGLLHHTNLTRVDSIGRTWFYLFYDEKKLRSVDNWRACPLQAVNNSPKKLKSKNFVWAVRKAVFWWRMMLLGIILLH